MSVKSELQEVLLKYDFVQYLRAHNVKDLVILNRSEPSLANGAIGALKRSGGGWYTYKRGSRNKIDNECRFQHQIDAYRHIAQMLGLTYKESKIVKDWESQPNSVKTEVLSSALDYYKNVLANMKTPPADSTVTRDIACLEENKVSVKSPSIKPTSKVFTRKIESPAVFAYHSYMQTPFRTAESAKRRKNEQRSVFLTKKSGKGESHT